MRNAGLGLLATIVMLGQAPAQQPSAENSIRLREFYRLAAQIQDTLWPGWSGVPATLLLVTEKQEFLTHHTSPPKGFAKISEDLYARPRQFPTDFLATFPAFGPPDVIVVGEAEHTSAKTSTPWLITVMHEHFHQLQDAQPHAFEDVMKLGLSHGDQTGMWMLNYPFPYGNAHLVEGFAHLRELLLDAIAESDAAKFAVATRNYVTARKIFMGQIAVDDRKYIEFQLWKEGIARYSQVKSAEAAANYQPTAQYALLPDYETFAHYAAHARQDTLDELRRADMSSWKRQVVYSWGAAEGFLLDRVNPDWRDSYFHQPFSLDSYF